VASEASSSAFASSASCRRSQETRSSSRCSCTKPGCPPCSTTATSLVCSISAWQWHTLSRARARRGERPSRSASPPPPPRRGARPRPRLLHRTRVGLGPRLRARGNRRRRNEGHRPPRHLSFQRTAEQLGRGEARRLWYREGDESPGECAKQCPQGEGRLHKLSDQDHGEIPAKQKGTCFRVLRVVSGCFVVCGRNCGSCVRCVDPATIIVVRGPSQI